MKKATLLALCALFIGLQINAQNTIENTLKETEENRIISRGSNTHKVLDGVFIKETAITRNLEYNNGYRPYHSNINFSLNRITKPIEDTINKDLPCLDSSIMRLSQLPKKLTNKLKEDFVFIEPIEKCYRDIEMDGFTQKTHYFIIDESQKKHAYRNFSPIFPYSLRCYLNPADIEIVPGQDCQVLDSNFRIQNKEELLQAFLFKKYEVTNKEYREFVNWVRDSIARELLYEEMSSGFKKEIIKNNGDTILIIDWEKELNWQGTAEKKVLEVLLAPNFERFYTNRLIDSRKLVYQCDVIEGLNIYPDTLCWINDFNYAFNEPLTNAYFWHPAYDDYPVVGINFWQVLAFLDWKTKQSQKDLNKEGISLKVTYSLPNDFQWDLVATAKQTADTIELFDLNYKNYSDKDWITNLKIKNTITKILDSIGIENGRKYYTTQEDQLYLLQNNANRFDRNFVEDKSPHTAKVNIDGLKKKDRQHPLIALNRDTLGICYMGANVSEWLDNDYKDQWKPIFDLRQKQLATSTNESLKILSSIEKYYDQKNAPDGKLVRGGNWFDERFSNLNGKNISGMNAKTFVSPDSSHSTLGFRYVITFEEK